VSVAIAVQQTVVELDQCGGIPQSANLSDTS